MERSLLSGRPLACLLSAALAACGPDQPADGGPSSAEAAGGAAPSSRLERPAVLVRVARPRRGRIETAVQVTTDVRSRRRVQVYSKVGGAYVLKVLADEGDPVAQGQTLCVIDDTDFRIEVKRRQSLLAQKRLAEVQAQTSLEEALARERAEKANLERARADYERAKAAMEGGVEVFSEKELTDLQKAYEAAVAQHEAVRLAVEQARSALELARLEREAAEVELEKARIDLEHTMVKSPIDGVVEERLVEEGLLVSPQTHLYTIVDPKDLIAHLRIPQEDFPVAGRVGLPVELRFDALPGRVVVALIEAVNPAIDPSSGLAKLRIALPAESSQWVRPGMFARARIIVRSRDDAWLLPKRALLREEGESRFFSVEDGRARVHRFVEGARTADEVEVLSVDGIPLSDSRLAESFGDWAVVVVGQDRLRDGDPVEVVDEEAPAR